MQTFVVFDCQSAPSVKEGEQKMVQKKEVIKE